MNYTAAQKLAGLLYGNILHRNADADGYDFYVKTLNDDIVSLKDLIIEFYTSEEFCQKFVVNQTPNELSRNLLASFYNGPDISANDVKSVVDSLIRQGLPAVITDLVNDPRFFDRHGNLGVPRYAENAQIYA
jgi:Domain of unknown function (DUF4214)